MTRFHEWVPDTPARMISGKTGRPVNPAACERAAKAWRSAQQAPRDPVQMPVHRPSRGRMRPIEDVNGV